jgi:hypothetical protein
MLTKIGEALGGWQPRSGGGDPLTLIRSAWTGIVGVDVARAAQPVAILNQALVIMTTSSAWSHQLTFLEPQIVRGLRDIAPAAAIVRLRFRVGAFRAAVPGSARRAHGKRTPGSASSTRPPALTAAEALERFRTVVERTRASHRAKGGGFCQDCAAPIRGRTRCVPCFNWARAELTAQCQRLLFDAPWLRPEDVLETISGLDAAAYDRIRRDLLRAWWDEMALARKRAELRRPIPPDRARLRKIASSYVLLETKLDPNRLEMDSPVRRNALGDLYEFIRSVEGHAAST